MEAKIGLVMTGGGARAAYQVGVTRALFEIIKKDKNLFDVITGNSAGALNACYLGSHVENWDVATQNLVELWKTVRPEYVYDLRTTTISELGFKLVSAAAFGGQSKPKSKVNYLLDTNPLKRFLQKEIDFNDLNNNIKKGHLHGMALSCTNYNSGSSVIFYQGHESIKDWARSDRFSKREDLNIDHLMGSAAIPFFFPPTKIGESYYGDGCIRQTTPLSPAIHLGADKIIAIGVRYPHPQDRMRDMAFSAFANPTLGQVAGVMLNAIFLDSLEADVERMMRINELIIQGNHPELKPIPILMIRPSRDLGKMTQKLNRELPGIMRYLLKGIGVSDNEGLDLLSYLAFEDAYTKPLMELGYEDALKMKDEIERFIDV
ncbi:MAG: patatin-like phospholipase family protein [Bacteriovoracaceae bacterium]